MKASPLHSFQNSREILVHVYQQKKLKNPHFTLRAFSRRMGFKGPSYLSDILNGKRRLKPHLAFRMGEFLDLEEAERKYFEALVYLENSKTDDEKQFFSSVCETFSGSGEKKGALATEYYPELKEWYYGVLDEMTCLSDFKEDYAAIAKRLDPALTPQAIEVAFKDMLRIGLVARDSRGKLHRPKKWFIKDDTELTQKVPLAVRKVRKKFMQKAIAAIDEQTKSESYFRQTNIPIAMKNFEKVVQLADEFVDHVLNLGLEKKSDEVIHIGLNVYRLTNPTKSSEATP